MSTCKRTMSTCMIICWHANYWLIWTLFLKFYHLLTYTNNIVSYTRKMQHTYVGMRLHYVNMRLMHVDMRVNYVKMQGMHVQMLENYVNMRPIDISIRNTCNCSQAAFWDKHKHVWDVNINKWHMTYFTGKLTNVHVSCMLTWITHMLT